MSFLRPLACTLLLAAMAAGQTSPSTGASPSGTAQPSNQAPQNPLQEATNPMQEQAKAPGSENKPMPSTFNVGDTSVVGTEDQQLGEILLMTRYTQLNGDVTRSFRTEGENNLGQFNYFLDHSLGEHRIQFLGMYRATDDQSIDPEHQSIQRIYVRFYSPKDEYILGDSLVSFSRLSFNQNIKGVNASWRVSDKWKLSVVTGIFVDRWGSLYKDLPGEPFTAVVSGVRMQYQFAPRGLLGFNFASSDDLVDSLPAAPPGTPPQPASNRVGSIDGKWQIGQFRLDSEFAYSFTNFDVRAGGCLAPTGIIILPTPITGPPPGCDSRMPTPGLGYQGDWGGRVEADYRYQKWRFRAALVRYQPNFASINARQIPDLQDAVFRISYDLTPWLTVDGTGRRSNNDLKNQLPFETRLWGPEARFSFHDLSFYPRGIFDIGFRYRDVQGTSHDPTRPCNPAPAAVTFNCIDRIVRIPYAEFTTPWRSTFFSIGFEYWHAVDFIDPAQTSNTPRWYTTFRGIYDWGGWHINPMFRYEINAETHRPRLGDPTFPPALRNLEQTDYNRLLTASLYVEAPRWFIAELAYRDSNATIFGPAGFNRPSYRAALTYKIRNDENMELIFAFERNNNYYKTSPNFDERITGLTFLYRFGKRR